MLSQRYVNCKIRFIRCSLDKDKLIKNYINLTNLDKLDKVFKEKF